MRIITCSCGPACSTAPSLASKRRRPTSIFSPATSSPNAVEYLGVTNSLSISSRCRKGMSGGHQVEGLELAKQLGLGQSHLVGRGIARERQVDRDVVLQVPALREEQDAGGELDGLAHVVRDEEDGLARLVPQLVQLAPQRAAG